MSRARRAAVAHQARQAQALCWIKGWTADRIQDELVRRFPGELFLGEARMYAHGWSVGFVREALQALAAEEGLDASGLQDADVLRWLRGEVYPRDSLDRLCRLFQCHQERLGWPVAGNVVAIDYSQHSPDRSGMPAPAFPFDTTTDISARMQRLSAVNVDGATLDTLDLVISDVVGRYEAEGPTRLAPVVVRVRRHVDELMQGHQHPDERRHLYRIAGRLSALLGYMAVNCGSFRLAGAYCAEAMQLAAGLEDADLRAWIRGTQSLAAYYQGRFADALEFALAGQHAAKQGPQAIRLAVNGEARALGRVGDRHGVDRAVDRAFQLAEVVVVPPGLTPCISFEPYSVARIAANAATAYLSLGDAPRALHYADEVEGLVDASDSAWSRSLVRLDRATALLRQDRPEVDEAMKLGIEALTVSADRPIRSVWQRAHELHAEAAPWSQLRQVGEYDDALRRWRARPQSRVAAGALAAAELAP